MNKRNLYLLPVILVGLTCLFPVGELALAVPLSKVERQPYHGRPGGDTAFPTDQIIVKFKTAVVPENLTSQGLTRQEQRLSQAAGVSINYLRQMSGEAYVFRFPEHMPLEQVQSISIRLSALPEVDYAEPDAILQPMLVPDDPRYPEQWHYFAPAPGNYGINAPAAWDVTTGSASVVVAVVDTGITEHAEFSGRTVPGYDFVSDINTANDGDGRDNDPRDPGDWVSVVDISSGKIPWDCQVANSSWHGTHTAGTIGAASNNHLGVAGIDWKAKILPVRVLGKCGGTTSDVVDGMRWAAGLQVPGVPNNAHPARVINVSLGGPAPCGIPMQEAVGEILAAGTTVVASAGNSNADAGGFTPGNCVGVITVAATNRDGSRANYSNYGPAIEISAPGGEQIFGNQNGVLSTWNTGLQGPGEDAYKFYEGTSMSAPHVTGVISLLYSSDSRLLPSQVLRILRKTATKFPAGSTCSTTTCGSGIVNAGAAVQAVAKIEYHPLYMPIIQK
jgi:serine protease